MKGFSSKRCPGRAGGRREDSCPLRQATPSKHTFGAGPTPDLGSARLLPPQGKMRRTLIQNQDPPRLLTPRDPRGGGGHPSLCVTWGQALPIKALTVKGPAAPSSSLPACSPPPHGSRQPPGLPWKARPVAWRRHPGLRGDHFNSFPPRRLHEPSHPRSTLNLVTAREHLAPGGSLFITDPGSSAASLWKNRVGKAGSPSLSQTGRGCLLLRSWRCCRAWSPNDSQAYVAGKNRDQHPAFVKLQDGALKPAGACQPEIPPAVPSRGAQAPAVSTPGEEGGQPGEGQESPASLPGAAPYGHLESGPFGCLAVREQWQTRHPVTGDRARVHAYKSPRLLKYPRRFAFHCICPRDANREAKAKVLATVRQF